VLNPGQNQSPVKSEFLDDKGKWRMELKKPEVKNFAGDAAAFKRAQEEYQDFINSTHVPASHWKRAGSDTIH
jgi:hypothetical protein